MTTTVSIININGKVIQEIEYTNIEELEKKLISLILTYDGDIHIQLLVDTEFLNNFNIINKLVLSILNNYNIITAVFSYKKDLYCLRNENGKYILDFKNDNYSMILKIFIYHYGNNSYNMIKNFSYKDLILKIIENDVYQIDVLQYISLNLRNDKEFFLKAITYNIDALNYTVNLQNDKEFILEAVKQDGNVLYYASSNLQNDKEIVLEAVKQNGLSLEYTFVNLKNDKDIVLEAVKQNGEALKFTYKLQFNKEIVLAAVMQDGNALYYASDNLQNDKEIVLAAVIQNVDALYHASNHLKNDPDILKIINDIK